MCTVPKPFSKEFRDDVVRVARDREPGQTIKQIAADFGIAESCLRNWLRQADVEEGYAELREAKKRTGPLPPGAAPSFSSSSNRIRRPICREMMSSPAPRRRRTTGFPLIGHLR